jgi:hypothetical protein
MQEREKTRKRRKPEEDNFDERVYRYLPNDILKQAIQQRLEEPDCNAGVVFDDLVSEFNGDPAEFAKLLSNVIGIQNLYLILLD